MTESLTNNLRWIRRGLLTVLQQEFVILDGSKLWNEWRDVPTVTDEFAEDPQPLISPVDPEHNKPLAN